MNVALILVALSVGSFSTERGNLAETAQAREARLLDAELESSARPSSSPLLRMLDAQFLGQTQLPRLDEGGGDRGDLRQVLALILGFVPGFGLGHLIARDRNGFILFLIVDIVLYAAGVIGGSLIGGGIGWGLGGLIWLVVHIFQAFDAYARAGGERIIQHTREKAVMYASKAREAEEDPLAITTRLFGFSF